MKIAITGASGFIGKKVIEELAGKTEIIALTRSISIEQTTEDARWVQTDYSVELLSEQFHGVDVVIHLAAVRGVSGNIADYQSNECLTENILIAMGNSGVRHIVFASSISVYSDTSMIPWTEEMALTPKTLYGITKAACEYLCSLYARQNNFSYTILRIAQVLGLEERRKGMMNVFIENAIHGEQLTVIGKSVAARQYIYVEDLAKAMAKCAMYELGRNSIVNIGMKEAYTNYQIAEIVNDVFQNGAMIDYQNNKNENIESSCMNIEKCRTQLDLVPRSLTEALYEIKEKLK